MAALQLRASTGKPQVDRILRDFLLADLQSDNPAFQLAAARRLGQVRYTDLAVTGALQQLRHAPSQELRAAAAAALAHYPI